ncbi:hypothetical protein [Desulfococcus sp.]
MPFITSEALNDDREYAVSKIRLASPWDTGFSTFGQRRDDVHKLDREEEIMERMPSRDTSGKCEGECRDRVFEGESERQAYINASDKEYDSPCESSPSWTFKRNDPPGGLGGRI